VLACHWQGLMLRYHPIIRCHLLPALHRRRGPIPIYPTIAYAAKLASVRQQMHRELGGNILAVNQQRNSSYAALTALRHASPDAQTSNKPQEQSKHAFPHPDRAVWKTNAEELLNRRSFSPITTMNGFYRVFRGIIERLQVQ